MAAFVLQVAGAVSVTIGCALLLPAAGFLAAGGFLLAFGVASSRAGV